MILILGRHLFRDAHPARSPVSRRYGGGQAQDGSVPEGRPARCTTHRITIALERAVGLHRSWRLGICLAAHEGQTARLAGYALALLRQACGEARRGEQARLVSNLPAHVRNTLQSNGENAKVVQELLRHASMKVTTDVHMQAVSSQKREAQSKLVKMVLKKRLPRTKWTKLDYD
jgi:integrase